MRVDQGGRAVALEPLESRRLFSSVGVAAAAADPAAPPDVQYHLTARPWAALNTPASAYLDTLESTTRAVATFQAADGRIIDPYEDREIQYSTPYFAYAVGVLGSAGRAGDLLPKGVAAMEVATDQFSRGVDAIENGAGEFFIAPLTEALPLYAPHVPAETMQVWRQRMATPIGEVLRGEDNNWRAYAMRGEWLRAKAGLVDPAAAREFIEASWRDTQAFRLEDDAQGLYHDTSSDPDSMVVESVGRINLLGLVGAGYDGPSAGRIRELVERGTHTSLYLQDPTGQAPTGGRTSGHVWNDLLYQANFETMARAAEGRGDAEAAGQYRRAAALSFQSWQRWRRPDGSFAVTKNQFDPADRVGYQRASFFTNYNGAIIEHLAELYRAGQEHPVAAPEQAAPAEIGGYVLSTDPAFATAYANAGGMQVQAALRGSEDVEKGQYWSTLGVTRFSRPGWDSRLGATHSDRDPETGTGASFSPLFAEDGQWVTLANEPRRYEGHLSVQSAHPMVTRFTIEYRPREGQTGPVFQNTFVVTPDGVLSSVTSDAPGTLFGVSWPLLEHDGATATELSITPRTASTRYSGAADELAYLSLSDSGETDNGASTVRGAYGDIRPVRSLGPQGTANETFVYPRAAGDPAADAVRASFRREAAGFSTVLGRVDGDVYVGRTSAGGVGSGVDLDADGTQDVTFSESCGFILQLGPDGRVTAVETDRAVTATVRGRDLSLQPYTPAGVGESDPGPGPGTEPRPDPAPEPPPQPPPSGPGTREVEALPVKKKSRGTLTAIEDAGAGGGAFARLDAKRTGDLVTYRVGDLEPGSYRVTVRVRKSADGGILQTFFPNGRKRLAPGPQIDLYAPTAEFAEIDGGNIELTGKGNKPRQIRFRVAGHNEQSAGFAMELDSVTFTRIE